MATQNDHPILSALEKVGYDDDGDAVKPATGGEPWHPQASWSTLQSKTDPNHMEVTEEAVKCYKLDQDQDIVDNRLYIHGEGRPVKTQMETLQEEVAALKGKSIPGVALQDIEIISSSLAGSLLGLLIIGAIIYYGLNFVFVTSIKGAYTQSYKIKGQDVQFDTLWIRFVDFMTKWFCPPGSGSGSG